MSGSVPTRSLHTPFMLLYCVIQFAVLSAADLGDSRPSGGTSSLTLSPMRQIDSVFVELIDITNDGVEDSVLVRVRAGDLDQPFQWTLDIRSNGRTVFHHGANDAWLDNNFGTPGFGESGNRIPAKQQYYFVDLPSMVVRHVSIRDTNTLFDRSSLGGIYTVLPEELRRIGVTEEGRLKVIVDIVVERLKVGTPILEVPISPVQLDFPRIYIDEVEQFVIFYRW